VFGGISSGKWFAVSSTGISQQTFGYVSQHKWQLKAFGASTVSHGTVDWMPVDVKKGIRYSGLENNACSVSVFNIHSYAFVSLRLCLKKSTENRRVCETVRTTRSADNFRCSSCGFVRITFEYPLIKLFLAAWAEEADVSCGVGDCIRGRPTFACNRTIRRQTKSRTVN